MARTRAGLGSGLELVIPGDLKDIWMNAPVEEDFVQDSSSLLNCRKSEGGYRVVRHEASDIDYRGRDPSRSRTGTPSGPPRTE